MQTDKIMLNYSTVSPMCKESFITLIGKALNIRVLAAVFIGPFGAAVLLLTVIGLRAGMQVHA